MHFLLTDEFCKAFSHWLSQLPVPLASQHPKAATEASAKCQYESAHNSLEKEVMDHRHQTKCPCSLSLSIHPLKLDWVLLKLAIENHSEDDDETSPKGQGALANYEETPQSFHQIQNLCKKVNEKNSEIKQLSEIIEEKREMLKKRRDILKKEESNLQMRENGKAKIFQSIWFPLSSCLLNWLWFPWLVSWEFLPIPLSYFADFSLLSRNQWIIVHFPLILSFELVGLFGIFDHFNGLALQIRKTALDAQKRKVQKENQKILSREESIRNEIESLSSFNKSNSENPDHSSIQQEQLLEAQKQLKEQYLGLLAIQKEISSLKRHQVMNDFNMCCTLKQENKKPKKWPLKLKYDVGELESLTDLALLDQQLSSKISFYENKLAKMNTASQVPSKRPFHS